MPSSMLTSMMLAPPRTWSSATCAASAQLPALIRRANFAEPVTLVRSPTIWKLESGRMTSGSSPDSSVRWTPLGFGPRRAAESLPPPSAIARDVIRRRAAAAADDVDEAAGGEVLHQLAGLGRQLVVLAEGVRQAGVRVAGDVALGDPREVGEVRAHVARAERAVDADAERAARGGPRCRTPRASGPTACGRSCR